MEEIINVSINEKNHSSGQDLQVGGHSSSQESFFNYEFREMGLQFLPEGEGFLRENGVKELHSWR